MKILITGDAGFVGRAFHRALDDKGHEITGIDIANGLDCRDFFKKDDTRYDVVIHLAAIVGGRATIEGNPLAVASDLAIDSDMFQWAVRTKPKHLVYFSSSAAYPIYLQKTAYKQRLREGDINLDHIRTPDLSYGWAKLTGETLARYARAEGIKVHVLRPFSGYGSDQDLDYPFPSLIARGKAKQEPIRSLGNRPASPRLYPHRRCGCSYLRSDHKRHPNFEPLHRASDLIHPARRDDHAGAGDTSHRSRITPASRAESNTESATPRRCFRFTSRRSASKKESPGRSQANKEHSAIIAP